MNKPEKNTEILNIKTVTLRYVALEDRMRMSARLEGDEQIVFWLTLRHCQRLLPALVKCLEGEKGIESAVEKSLAHSFRQKAAEWEKKEKPSAEPVLPSGEERSLLPESVTVVCAGKGVALFFPIEEGKKSAKLTMSLQELRQWLAILYRQFRKAEWSLDMWPEWFTGRSPHGMN